MSWSLKSFLAGVCAALALAGPAVAQNVNFPASGGAPSVQLGWASNKTYGTPTSSVGTCAPANSTTMYLQQQIIPANGNLASGQIRTSVSSGNFKLAIYSNVNGRPGALLYTTASTASASGDVTAAFTGGPYLFATDTVVWKAFLADNSTITVVCVLGNDPVVSSIVGGASFVNATGTSNLTTGVTAPVTSYAAGFPATASTIGALSDNSGNTPAIDLHSN